MNRPPKKSDGARIVDALAAHLDADAYALKLALLKLVTKEAR